jgi:hypothetical protein
MVQRFSKLNLKHHITKHSLKENYHFAIVICNLFSIAYNNMYVDNIYDMNLYYIYNFMGVVHGDM